MHQVQWWLGLRVWWFALPDMSPNYDFDVGFLADTAMSRTPEPPCKRQLSFEYPDNQLGLDVT